MKPTLSDESRQQLDELRKTWEGEIDGEKMMTVLCELWDHKDKVVFILKETHKDRRGMYRLHRYFRLSFGEPKWEVSVDHGGTEDITEILKTLERVW